MVRNTDGVMNRRYIHLSFNVYGGIKVKLSKSMEHSGAWREIQYLEFATYNLLLFTPFSVSFFYLKIN